MGYRPWTELGHPGGARLNDLEFHVVFVPVAVSPSDHILRGEIGTLDVAERNLLVAEGQDAVEMVFNQADELVVGLEAAPFEFGLPSRPELQHAGLVRVIPQTAERLLEQMRFQEFRTGGEDVVERLPSLTPNPRPPGQQDELLAGERLLEAPKLIGKVPVTMGEIKAFSGTGQPGWKNYRMD